MDLLSERSSPDKNPLMMNPVPTGFATGNNAMNEEMNMKTKLSFNILICRVLLCLTIVSARLAAKFFRASEPFYIPMPAGGFRAAFGTARPGAPAISFVIRYQ